MNEDKVVVGEIIERHQTALNMSQSLIQNVEDIKLKLTDILLDSPAFLESLKSVIPKKEYTAMVSSSQRAKLAAGTLKFMRSADGTTYASLVDKGNLIYANIPIKEISDTQGFTTALTSYFQQRQLARIANQLRIMQQQIESVRLGQIDDRFALAYSCEQKYLQATVIENENIKNLALLQVISDSEDSRNKLMKRQERNLDYIMSLPETTFSKLINIKKTKGNDDKMLEIRETFNAINMVSVVEAISYQEMGEFNAAKRSFEYYTNHLETVYLDNNKVIARLDSLDLLPDNYWSINVPEINQSILKFSQTDSNSMLEELNEK